MIEEGKEETPLQAFDREFADFLDKASHEMTIAEITGALELQLHILKNRFTGYKQAAP